jgi:hypothetical protein
MAVIDRLTQRVGFHTKNLRTHHEGKRNKGPRRQAAAVRDKEEGNRELQRIVWIKTAITPGKRRNRQWDFQREDRETSSPEFQRVTKNKKMDLVEGSTPSKMKRKGNGPYGRNR